MKKWPNKVYFCRLDRDWNPRTVCHFSMTSYGKKCLFYADGQCTDTNM